MVNFDLEKPQPDLLYYISENELLSHLRYLAYKDFHIEMYKIVKDNKNNTDNIFALLKKQKDEDETRREDCNKCLTELTKNKNAINHICETRDKFYAHLDKDFESYRGIRLSVPMALDCFIAIENSIITLTSREILIGYLDKIPSKNDLHL